MKDAKGHGSNKRGANSVDTVFSSKAGVGGLGHGMYARLASGEQYKLNPAATGGRIPSVGSTLNPSDHTRVIAAQHGISTDHLNNSQGHAYGSPEAIKDFTRQYGGPRDHAAIRRSFGSGAREINRLRRQGK